MSRPDSRAAGRVGQPAVQEPGRVRLDPGYDDQSSLRGLSQRVQRAAGERAGAAGYAARKIHVCECVRYAAPLRIGPLPGLRLRIDRLFLQPRVAATAKREFSVGSFRGNDPVAAVCRDAVPDRPDRAGVRRSLVGRNPAGRKRRAANQSRRLFRRADRSVQGIRAIHRFLGHRMRSVQAGDG